MPESNYEIIVKILIHLWWRMSSKLLKWVLSSLHGDLW